MLISRRHGFLFIHIPKTAGTSAMQVFGRYADGWPAFSPTDFVRRMLGKPSRVLERKVSKPFGLLKHASAREAREKLGEEAFNSLFRFAFVRNPWDWHVSLYHYILRHPEHRRHELFKAMSGFDEYVGWAADNMYTQSSLICDGDGTPLVNFVGRLETVSEDVDRVLAELGLPLARLPHFNQGQKRDYRTLYNAETRETIGTAFKEDIDRFGYDFDGIANPSAPIESVPPHS